MDNQDLKKLIIRVFDNDEGRLLLKHLYQKNVNISIANTPDLLEIGKRQGRADLVRQLHDMIIKD